MLNESQVRIYNLFCTYVTHIIVIICLTQHFISTFILMHRAYFPSQFCVFFTVNHLSLLKDRILKKTV